MPTFKFTDGECAFGGALCFYTVWEGRAAKIRMAVAPVFLKSGKQNELAEESAARGKDTGSMPNNRLQNIECGVPIMRCNFLKRGFFHGKRRRKNLPKGGVRIKISSEFFRFLHKEVF